jgi:hypothetical protein
MKKPITVLVGILAILIVLSVVKNAVIKVSVEKGVEFATGLKLNMRSLNIGIIKTLVGIKSLTILNPKGYPDRTMLDMPEIYVDYNLPSVFKGKIHLEEMRIDLKEFMVVKNEAGELNLDSLKVVKAQKEGKAEEKKKTRGQAPGIRIDSLDLKIGKVVYKDYSKGGEPVVKEINVNINERYKDIDNAYELVSLILVRSLVSARITNLVKIDMRKLQASISDTLSTATKVASEAAAQAEQKLREGAEKSREAVEETTEKAKAAAEEFKEGLKGIFGSEEK